MPGDSDQQVTIKTETGSVFKRLPSFRTPRDLKLSEFRDVRSNHLNENRTKRVFVPNLNVQRKKQTENPKDKSPVNNDVSKQPLTERGKRDLRGRGRGRRSGNFIQGTGIFSEGLAPTLKHWHSSRTSDASTSVPKPKLNLKENKKVNKEEEEEVIKELLRDDFIDDPDVQPDAHHCPVKLPLQNCKDLLAKCEIDDVCTKIGSFENQLNGIKVKSENDTLENNDENFNEFGESVSKPVCLHQMKPWSIPQLLSKSSDKSFLFFQIPSCLPSMKVNMQTSVHQSKKDTPKNELETPEKCVLRTLPPGRVGKLQILKSGRARLILGDVKFWVEPGTQTVFKQDLISVNLDASNKNGNMVHIGDLTTRMLITPDWDSLLAKQRAF